MYFLICTNIDHDIINYEVCTFMEKPQYLENKTQFFREVKKNH